MKALLVRIGDHMRTLGWTGDDLSAFLFTEMDGLLLDETRLSADRLASLLAARGKHCRTRSPFNRSTRRLLDEPSQLPFWERARVRRKMSGLSFPVARAKPRGGAKVSWRLFYAFQFDRIRESAGRAS
jgi:hypothetical protein